MIKGRYFILNKKAQDCLQTLALVTKHMILHSMENFDHSTGKI